MLRVDIKYIKEVFGNTECIITDICTPFKTCRIYGNGYKTLVVVTIKNQKTVNVKNWINDSVFTDNIIIKKNHILHIITRK